MNKDSLGVALTKELCPACLKEMNGAIVMNTRLSIPQARKVEELHGKVVGIADHFCEECDGYAKQGIIIVTIDESKTEDRKNPWRTGGFFVVTDSYIERLMDDSPALLEQTLEKRMCYMPHEVAEGIGLFEAGKNEESGS